MRKLLLVPIVFLSLYLTLLTYVWVKASEDNSVYSDAIIVLGARGYINGDYNPCLKARVIKGIELYKAGFAPTIIMSGGTDIEDNTIEAETMEKIALEAGVDPQDIILEPKSDSTYTNLLNSRQLMRENSINSAIIVTEPFHTPRASLVAQNLGLNYTIAPATESICWTRNKYISEYILKEPIAIMYYWVRDKI